MSDVREQEEASEEVSNNDRGCFEVGLREGNVYLTVRDNGWANIWLTPDRARELALQLAACAKIAQGVELKQSLDEAEKEIGDASATPTP
jgi:hypothetical protein